MNYVAMFIILENCKSDLRISPGGKHLGIIKITQIKNWKNNNIFYFIENKKVSQGYRCESGISMFTWRVT